MIIDKIKKLIKFLSNKPVQAINHCLDCTTDFVLQQVNYAYLATFSLVALSMVSVIITFPKGSQHNQNRLGQQNLTIGTQNKARPLVTKGVLVKLASSSSKKAKNVANYIKPIPENVKNRLPVTFILSYSLSRPDYVKLFPALKAYQVYGQMPLLESSINDNISYGLFLDSYTVVQPVIPILHREISQTRLYAQLLSLFGAINRGLNQNNVADDINNHFYQSIDDQSASHSSTQSHLQHSTDITGNDVIPDEAFASTSASITRTTSVYPGVSSTRNRNRLRNKKPKVEADRQAAAFQKFKRHILSSFYFKIDVLRTFIFRIEQ